MNKLLPIFIFIMILLLANYAVSSSKDNLKTEFKFSGSSVNGQVLNSLPATATVENEKVLNDMFGVRQNFKDRVKKSLKDSEVFQ